MECFSLRERIELAKLKVSKMVFKQAESGSFLNRSKCLQMLGNKLLTKHKLAWTKEALKVWRN